jgi:hypothetical protein
MFRAPLPQSCSTEAEGWDRLGQLALLPVICVCQKDESGGNCDSNVRFFDSYRRAGVWGSVGSRSSPEHMANS